MRQGHRSIRTARAAQSLAASRAAGFKLALLASAGLLAAFFALGAARADAALCTAAQCTADSRSNDERFLRFSTALPGTRAIGGLHHTELSNQDFSSFSGVGMIVCTAEGESRTSTAFLVGAFDIAVTVAHTFETQSGAQPHCVYNSTDSLGQIRERIPVAYTKSQWEIEPGASGELSKDLAVVRLTQPSRYAQRTMPLGRFSGTTESVVMIGFKDAIYSDTLKLKKRGRIYDQGGPGLSAPSIGGFMHDMDSLNIAAGAPVIDERTGVIIGIHTRLQDSKNTMITMNDWLEATLRTELQTKAN
jgi:hypothetical protein